MNNNVKIAIGFALGAALGCGISYLYFREKMLKEMRETIDKEIQEYKNYIDSKNDKKEDTESIDDHIPDKPTIKRTLEFSSDEDVEIDEEEFYDKLEENLAQYEFPTEDDYEDDVNYQESSRIISDSMYLSRNLANGNYESEENPLLSLEKPTIIDIEEVANEITLETVCLTYFMRDDQLVDDLNNEILAEIESLIGEENLTNFARSKHTVMHVLNNRLGIVYEICKDYGAYSIDVLGLDEEHYEPINERL